MSLNILNFSDVHFGAGDPERYYNEEIVPLLEQAYNLPKIDLISSCGELFDKRVYVDDPTYIFINRFKDDLKDLGKLHNCPVIFIEGTDSHERGQYAIFKDDPELIIVSDSIQYFTVDNYVIRCIPDLTWDSYEEFSKAAFSRYADITLMHGLIEGAIPLLDDKAHNSKRSVVVKLKDLEKNTKLFTVAGHIHERMFLSDSVWYTGATSASSFKDANNNLFGIDYIIVKGENFTPNFIKNKNTRVFKTVNINKIVEGKSLESIKAQLTLMKRAMKANEVIRLDINDTDRLSMDDRINIRTIKTLFADTFTFHIIVSMDGILSDETVDELSKASEEVLSSEYTLAEKIEMDVRDNNEIDFSIRKKLNLNRIEVILSIDIF